MSLASQLQPWRLSNTAPLSTQCWPACSLQQIKGGHQLLGCQGDGNPLRFSFPFYINLKHFVCRAAVCSVVGMLLSLPVKELVRQAWLGPRGTQHRWSKNFQTAAPLRSLLHSSVSSGRPDPVAQFPSSLVPEPLTEKGGRGLLS